MSNHTNINVRENVITKKREEYKQNDNIIKKIKKITSVKVLEKEENNMVIFNNLVFMNKNSLKFTGNFSLLYKITDYVKFSYFSNNLEDILRAIIEAYLQKIFNNYEYYQYLSVNNKALVNDLNMLISKYIEGIKVLDSSNIKLENHFNYKYLDDFEKKTDKSYTFNSANNKMINDYDSTGRFVISTEVLNSYNLASYSSVNKNKDNLYSFYLNSNEYAINYKNKVVSDGFHLNFFGYKNVNNLNGNVLKIDPVDIYTYDKQNVCYKNIVEAKLIFQITDPKKYINAQKEYRFIDFINYSFYNFLLNYSQIYQIDKMPSVLNHNNYISFFKKNNEEYILKLKEFGISINSICIVGYKKAKLTNNMSRTKRLI